MRSGRACDPWSRRSAEKFRECRCRSGIACRYKFSGGSGRLRLGAGFDDDGGGEDGSFETRDFVLGGGEEFEDVFAAPHLDAGDESVESVGIELAAGDLAFVEARVHGMFGAESLEARAAGEAAALVDGAGEDARVNLDQRVRAGSLEGPDLEALPLKLGQELDAAQAAGADVTGSGQLEGRLGLDAGSGEGVGATEGWSGAIFDGERAWDAGFAVEGRRTFADPAFAIAVSDAVPKCLSGAAIFFDEGVWKGEGEVEADQHTAGFHFEGEEPAEDFFAGHAVVELDVSEGGDAAEPDIFALLLFFLLTGPIDGDDLLNHWK
jgi:hypothetical protein